MPYCNQCGRYIGGGMFCNRCGEAREDGSEEVCRGLDGMPTPDGHDTTEIDEEIKSGEMPSNTGSTPIENQEDDPFVHAGEDVCGDTNREVVSEGRTIVTEEDEETPPAEEAPPAAEKKRVRDGIGKRLLGMLARAASYGEDDFPPHERRAGRCMAVLCYLGVLWAIPYFTARSSRYVAHHLERGLNLLLVGCLGLTLGAAALAVGGIVPILMPLFAAGAELVLLVSITGSGWNIIRLFAAEKTRKANG